MVGYEGLLNDLYNGKINNAEFGRQVSALETLNTDWFDLLTRDSFSNQHTISLSGGSGTSRYYTSIGFVNNEDVIKDNYNKRYTATLNIDNQINKWLMAAFSIKGNVNDRKYYQDEIAPMDYAYSTARTIPAYAQDGSGDYFYYKKNYSKLLGQNFNILNELENSSYKQDVKTVTADANFQLKFTDYLKASAIFSYGISNSTIEGYWGPETYHASVIRGTDPGVLPSVGSSTEMPMGGELTENHVRNNYYTIRAQVDFNKYLDPEQIHNISASLGYEMSSTKYKEYKNVTRGYFPDRGMSFVDNINLDDYPYYKTWMANNNPVLGNSLTNIMSGYATLSYAYKYLFIVNANARIDGSNQFGDRSNEKLLPIWSVSGLFNAAELDFLQNDWLDYLNFKASYGYQGNMLNSEYPVLCIKKNALDSYYNEYTASVADRKSVV